jgi:hypothetical protein
MEFMRNAPYNNKKDGRSRPGLRLAWKRQAKPKAILCNHRPDREAGIARPGLSNPDRAPARLTAWPFAHCGRETGRRAAPPPRLLDCREEIVARREEEESDARQ